jgi:hypothetical protein
MALAEETAIMVEPDKLPDGSVVLIRAKLESWYRAQYETDTAAAAAAAATPAIDSTAFTQIFHDQKHEQHDAKR